MRKLSLLVFCLTLALAVPSVMRADNLVLNGDFSAGNADWTTTQTTGEAWRFNSSPSYASGGCVGQICITGAPGEQSDLFQFLNTTAGDSYTLSFEFAAAGDTMELQALFDGNIAVDLTGLGSTPLTPYSISGLIASTNSTKLNFLVRQDPSWNELTDIVVTDNGPAGVTPEPSSLMLFGTGIVGFAGFLRRKLA